ncbi:CoA transferase [Ottowia sp. GY511]|uniref:CaiB/BaiF CoA transferase family protein n=1 Tax=Ottowia flava TaxID=2675430 RepID=A0ABW4KW52_9BURK|nr:CoA transferase [Ottowia sp. GY511]TXK23301.1 CoA transferase [Ottowia sp. GY511]
MFQALQGVRVVDMSHVIAGPLASFYLAQLGAEVIKIESPEGGDVMRSSKARPEEGDTPGGFAALNAGKRSFAVDIRTPEGARLVRSLAATADVFIENFRPGVVKRHGLDYDAIRAVKPNILYCSISGYGQAGDWAGRGAYDHVVQALTGMMMMNGDSPEAPPMKVGFPVIDVAVGMLGALSIVAALQGRSRDGQGQYIDVSMVQASLMLMYPNASNFLTSRAEPPRAGNRGYTGSPAADTYRCRDGWLSTAANTPAQFRQMAAVLGLEHLCDDAEALDLDAFNAPGGFVVPRDVDRVRAAFNAALAERSAADIEEALNARGVPAARVRKLGEFLDEVQVGSKLPFTPVRYAQGVGTVRTPGIGFPLGHGPAQGLPGAPRLGGDTRAVLSELGVPAADARALADAGIVREATHQT